MAAKSYDQILEEYTNRSYKLSDYLLLATDNSCIRTQVIKLYKESKESREGELNDAAKRVVDRFDPAVDNNVRDAAYYCWTHDLYQAINQNCAASAAAKEKENTTASSHETETSEAQPEVGPRPFDRRLDRLTQHVNNKKISSGNIVPMASEFGDITTSGYLLGLTEAQNAKDPKVLEAAKREYQKIKSNEFYKGVPALTNNYAIVRLFGSNGGAKLVNQKGQRRWYEVDATSDNNGYNFASTPTTSALIDWGNGDPYGRTPYAFTDFVFSKYWKKIENNRLITLRRYAAPILDNLKFPGMKGGTDTGSDTATGVDQGSSSPESPPFPPMASAITYFGGDTGNSLNSILKFSTGVLWDDAQAAVWEVTTDSVPDNKSGAGAIYGGLAKFAEMLNVAGGNFDRDLIMNNGQLPPDPYNNGPYENRIMGPINRIDSVKKRKPGLAFAWDGLNLVFEYVARPVGGISPKAVLLDIMSNFLVIGSASAVFFGGAHRFMAIPEKYPFLGGDEGIEKWYKGDPIGWGLTAIRQFSGDKGKGSGTAAASSLLDSAKAFVDQIFSGEKGSGFGAITSLFTGAAGNIMNNEIAKKTAGQVPYLQGLKAVLTGEPVGEWHVTIGNPLNPIAMIGNLICEGIDVDFNDELGPDDFPTELKVTVKLKHAMNRDRDAIESIFNRGMGRIYNLPDSFLGSADYQTVIDQATGADGKQVQTGLAPNRRMGVLYHEGDDSGRIDSNQLKGQQLMTGGEVSVWNRSSFKTGISENSNQQASTIEISRSAYRAADWIAKKSI